MQGHYRIHVDSRSRSSGHEFDFDYDISGMVTARDLVGKTWMCGVEWCDPVAYSESSSLFAKDLNAPGTILLTSPTLTANNTWESWSKSPGGTLACLQNYVQYGYYGMSAELPYLRRAHLGVVVQGDRINQAGSLRFRLLMPGAQGMVPLRQPDGASVHGKDFAFSLVFWEVDSVDPERPLPAYYDFYKVYLSSRDRQPGGTPGDCEIPISLTTSGSMSTGFWNVAIESFSTVKHSVGPQDLPRGITVVSNSFPDTHCNTSSRVIRYLARTYRQQEEGYFGLRLSHKPVSRDQVGHPVFTPLDNMRSIHIGLRGAADGLPLLSAATALSEWVCCLIFYRKH